MNASSIQGEEAPPPDAHHEAGEEEREKRQRGLQKKGDREVVPPAEVAVAAGQKRGPPLHQSLTVQKALAECIRQQVASINPADERGDRRNGLPDSRVIVECEQPVRRRARSVAESIGGPHSEPRGHGEQRDDASDSGGGQRPAAPGNHQQEHEHHRTENRRGELAQHRENEAHDEPRDVRDGQSSRRSPEKVDRAEDEAGHADIRRDER